MYQHSAAVTSDGKLYAPCQRPFGPNSLKDIATHTRAQRAHARAQRAHTRMHSVEPALRRCGVAKAEAHAKCAGLTRLRTTWLQQVLLGMEFERSARPRR
jgi:hypothetical protein